MVYFELFWPHRLTARTSAFHAGNRGSIPRGVTNLRSSVIDSGAMDKVVDVSAKLSKKLIGHLYNKY